MSVDDTLLESRQHLEMLKTEYIQTKAAYEAALAKMDTLDNRINELLDTRENNYKYDDCLHPSHVIFLFFVFINF